MANIKVSEMTEATSFDDNDYTMIVQANQNKKINRENMLGDIETNIGDMSNLTTPVTSSLVGAINSIVDSGSNANGDYIKYADGTMICTKQKTVTAQISRAFGGLYETQSSISFGDYAETFIAIPIVVALCIGRTAILEGLQNQSTTSYGNTWLMRPIADSSANDYVVNLIAIGKWK